MLETSTKFGAGLMFSWLNPQSESHDSDSVKDKNAWGLEGNIKRYCCVSITRCLQTALLRKLISCVKMDIWTQQLHQTKFLKSQNT